MSNFGSDRSNSVRRLALAFLTLIILALGVLGMGQLAAQRKPPIREATEGFLPLVRVVTPRLEQYREHLEGYGRARALRAAKVLAEVTGNVAEIAPALEAGTEVEADQVLLRIDPRDFEFALQQAQATLDQAVADLARTKAEQQGMLDQLKVARSSLDASARELERAVTLAKDDLATANEVDILRRAHELQQRQVVELESLERAVRPRIEWGESDIERHRAAVAKAQLDLERTTIRSPFAGRVERRTTDLGQRVAPGTSLFDLVDLSRIEVPIALPGSRFGEVALGAPARVRLREDGDVVWEGQVKRIAPAIDPANRTFEVYLEIENEPHQTPVPPGAFVLATIDGMLHEQVRAVPRGAFVDGQLLVARVDTGDPKLAHVEALRVQVHRFLADVALVESGLGDEDRVVVTNLERIAPGSRVRLEVTGTTPSENAR